MYILLIILSTVLFDWLVGFLVNHNKKKQLKRDEELFIFKLVQILQDKNSTGKERKDRSLELCRMTDMKIASGSYIALCDIELLD